MDPHVAEAIAPLLALLGFGSMVLLGIKMRYTHLQRMKQHQVGGEDVERLAEDVAMLREAVRELREEHVELFERLDFAERVLTKGKEGGGHALPGGQGPR